MHPVLIKHILNDPLLKQSPVLPLIKIALADDDVLGPVSLAKALKKVMPHALVDNIVDTINMAIKEVESKKSRFNIDIDLIMSQTDSSHEIARATYLKNNGDIVESIMELTMVEPTSHKVIYGIRKGKVHHRANDEDLPSAPFLLEISDILKNIKDSDDELHERSNESRPISMEDSDDDLPALEKVYDPPHRTYTRTEAEGVLENKSYDGAIVVDPEIGLYEQPVSTLDFASLYPSIYKF
jgi:PII-like signaling protein